MPGCRWAGKLLAFDPPKLTRLKYNHPGLVVNWGVGLWAAADVTDFPVKPDDIAATIYESLGIPHDLILHDQKGQPHKISAGQPVWDLMS